MGAWRQVGGSCAVELLSVLSVMRDAQIHISGKTA